MISTCIKMYICIYIYKYIIILTYRKYILRHTYIHYAYDDYFIKNMQNEHYVLPFSFFFKHLATINYSLSLTIPPHSPYHPCTPRPVPIASALHIQCCLKEPKKYINFLCEIFTKKVW